MRNLIFLAMTWSLPFGILAEPQVQASPEEAKPTASAWVQPWTNVNAEGFNRQAWRKIAWDILLEEPSTVYKFAKDHDGIWSDFALESLETFTADLGILMDEDSKGPYRFVLGSAAQSYKIDFVLNTLADELAAMYREDMRRGWVPLKADTTWLREAWRNQFMSWLVWDDEKNDHFEARSYDAEGFRKELSQINLSPKWGHPLDGLFFVLMSPVLQKEHPELLYALAQRGSLYDKKYPQTREAFENAFGLVDFRKTADPIRLNYLNRRIRSNRVALFVDSERYLVALSKRAPDDAKKSGSNFYAWVLTQLRG